VAGDVERLVEEEVASEELALRSLVADASLKGVLFEEGKAAVWILGLDGDEERGRWPTMVDRAVGREQAK
jgi:hypothetical protein